LILPRAAESFGFRKIRIGIARRFCYSSTLKKDEVLQSQLAMAYDLGHLMRLLYPLDENFNCITAYEVRKELGVLGEF
jgi:hypothetical protein